MPIPVTCEEGSAIMGDAIVNCDYYISSFSGGGDCVAVARLPSGEYAVRHSREATAPIVFTVAEWDAFRQGVKAGEFDF